MLPIKFDKPTRIFSAPTDWEGSTGPCLDLEIVDIETEEGPFMVSAWKPDDEELQMLKDGTGVVYLRIRGTIHPVVSLSVYEG